MEIVKRKNFIPSTSFFDDFLTRDLFDWPQWSAQTAMVPKVNVTENDENFMVEMAAPGLKKEDFNIELDNDMLTIKSEVTHDEKDEQDGSYTRREFSYQSFQRSFYLPNTVEADKIKANYKDGLLRLQIPKKEEAKRKPTKRISIS